MSVSMTCATRQPPCFCAPVCLWWQFKKCYGEDPKLTAEAYGHLEQDFLRAEIDRLTVEGMPSATKVASLSATSPNRGTPAGPNSARRPKMLVLRKQNGSGKGDLGERAILDSNQWPSAPEADALSI